MLPMNPMQNPRACQCQPQPTSDMTSLILFCKNMRFSRLPIICVLCHATYMLPTQYDLQSYHILEIWVHNKNIEVGGLIISPRAETFGDYISNIRQPCGRFHLLIEIFYQLTRARSSLGARCNIVLVFNFSTHNKIKI